MQRAKTDHPSNSIDRIYHTTFSKKKYNQYLMKDKNYCFDFFKFFDIKLSVDPPQLKPYHPI